MISPFVVSHDSRKTVLEDAMDHYVGEDRGSINLQRLAEYYLGMTLAVDKTFIDDGDQPYAFNGGMAIARRLVRVLGHDAAAREIGLFISNVQADLVKTAQSDPEWQWCDEFPPPLWRQL